MQCDIITMCIGSGSVLLMVPGDLIRLSQANNNALKSDLKQVLNLVYINLCLYYKRLYKAITKHKMLYRTKEQLYIIYCSCFRTPIKSDKVRKLERSADYTAIQGAGAALFHKIRTKKSKKRKIKPRRFCRF